jgi:hypothetical protein
VSPLLLEALVFSLLCVLAYKIQVAALHIQMAEIDAVHMNTWMGLDTCYTSLTLPS